jgi:hypothetical protein
MWHMVQHDNSELLQRNSENNSEILASKKNGQRSSLSVNDPAGSSAYPPIRHDHATEVVFSASCPVHGPIGVPGQPLTDPFEPASNHLNLKSVSAFNRFQQITLQQAA